MSCTALVNIVQRSIASSASIYEFQNEFLRKFNKKMFEFILEIQQYISNEIIGFRVLSNRVASKVIW